MSRSSLHPSSNVTETPCATTIPTTLGIYIAPKEYRLSSSFLTLPRDGVGPVPLLPCPPGAPCLSPRFNPGPVNPSDRRTSGRQQVWALLVIQSSQREAQAWVPQSYRLPGLPQERACHFPGAQYTHQGSFADSHLA